jgi:hypothetical protein
MEQQQQRLAADVMAERLEGERMAARMGRKFFNKRRYLRQYARRSK